MRLVTFQEIGSSCNLFDHFAHLLKICRRYHVRRAKREIRDEFVLFVAEVLNADRAHIQLGIPAQQGFQVKSLRHRTNRAVHHDT